MFKLPVKSSILFCWCTCRSLWSPVYTIRICGDCGPYICIWVSSICMDDALTPVHTACIYGLCWSPELSQLSLQHKIYQICLKNTTNTHLTIQNVFQFWFLCSSYIYCLSFNSFANILQRSNPLNIGYCYCSYYLQKKTLKRVHKLYWCYKWRHLYLCTKYRGDFHWSLLLLYSPYIWLTGTHYLNMQAIDIVLDARTQNGDEPVGEYSFLGQSCLSSADSCWNG